MCPQLTNGIIYFNSLILSKLLDHFDAIGDEKTQAFVKPVSQVAGLNINLNEMYLLSFNANALNKDDVISPISSE